MLLELAIAGVVLSAIKKRARKKRLRLFLKPEAAASRRRAIYSEGKTVTMSQTGDQGAGSGPSSQQLLHCVIRHPLDLRQHGPEFGVFAGSFGF